MIKSLNIGFIIKLIMTQSIIYLLGLSLSIIIQINPIVTQWENLIYKNISIEQIDLTGHTRQEATLSINEHYINQITNKVIRVHVEDQTFTLPLNEIITTFNTSDVTQEAVDFGKNLSILSKYNLITEGQSKNFHLSFTYDEDAILSFVKQVNHTITHPPTDAQIIKRPKEDFRIIPEQPSYILDEKALVNLIKLSLEQKIKGDISLTAPVQKVEPSYTTTTLSSIDTLIATFTTSCKGSSSGRLENIKLSAEAINGTLLMPGHTFSFNDIVGQTTSEKGYKKAPAISNGNIISELGGGICQVSSTLYNAVLRAGLDSVERRPHSKPVSYVPLGLDATISFGSIDYKFQNTFDYPLYIESYIENNMLYTNLYSHRDVVNKDFIIESSIYSTLSSPITYQYDPQLSPAQTSMLRQGTKGYKVKSYRKTYEKGELIDSELIANDLYSPTPTIYKIGQIKK